MTVEEYLVRGNLVSARVLSILDGQSHYRNLVHARVIYDPSTDPGGRLELVIASAESQYSPPEVEAAMEGANKRDRAALADLHATRKIPRQKEIGSLLEAIASGVASGKLRDEASFGEVLKLHKQLKQIARVDVSINYADVMADNQMLKQEAQQLLAQGEQAADLVVQYLDETLQLATTTRGFGPFSRSVPVTGIERNVRDYFFIHNLFKGEGWGYVMSESGLLLVEGGKHSEAIDDLVTAEHIFGYKDPAVYLGLGKAYRGVGGNSIDQAIEAFNAVLKDAPADVEANAALTEIYRQKAAQTRRSVEPQIVHHGVLADARQNLTPDSIEAANISNREKASQLYNLAIAYLTLQPQYPDDAIRLLQSSLALEPRKETYSWLAEAHSRIATGTLYTPPVRAGYHPTAGPSLLGGVGQAVRAVMTTPIHLRTPITLGRR